MKESASEEMFPSATAGFANKGVQVTSEEDMGSPWKVGMVTDSL